MSNISHTAGSCKQRQLRSEYVKSNSDKDGQGKGCLVMSRGVLLLRPDKDGGTAIGAQQDKPKAGTWQLGISMMLPILPFSNVGPSMTDAIKKGSWEQHALVYADKNEQLISIGDRHDRGQR